MENKQMKSKRIMEMVACVLLVSAAVTMGCQEQSRGAHSVPKNQENQNMVNESAAKEQSAAANVQREGSLVRLTNVSPATGGGNGYVHGLETLLVHAGVPVDYNRLMGLSGLAFIFQADREDNPGWWPLDPWGLKLHREFLARAVGYELTEVGVFYDSHQWPEASRDDAREAYLKQIHPDVVRQIDAGQPVLVTFCPTDAVWGFVIFGYDHTLAADKPPVWGRCARETTDYRGYCEDWPFGVILLGQRLAPMDPDAADLTALRNAVALAHDQAGPTDAPGAGRRFTGQKAWAVWAALLRNVDDATDDHQHGNSRNQLIQNRTAAVAYLRSVADRYDAQAGGERRDEAVKALRAAAATYEKVLEQANRLDVAGVSTDAEKRRQQADTVERLATLEQEAIAHLSRAIDAMEGTSKK